MSICIRCRLPVTLTNWVLWQGHTYCRRCWQRGAR